MAKYEEILTVQNVLVRVPAEGQYMNPIKAFKTPESLVIPQHYRHGMLVGDGRILNRNFYVSPEDLGRNIIATVIIKKKTVEGGREFIMIDISKEMSPGPRKEMKLIKFGTPSNGDVPIIGTKWLIRFQDR